MTEEKLGSSVGAGRTRASLSRVEDLEVEEGERETQNNDRGLGALPQGSAGQPEQGAGLGDDV